MSLFRAAASAFLASLLASSAMAQDWTPPAKRVSPHDGWAAQLKPSGATPRTADGHPDLSGNWGGGATNSPYPASGSRGLEFFEPDQASLQRATAWNKPIYKPQFWEKVYNLDYGKVTDDPTFHCLPRGVPRQNAPNRILQTPKEILTFNGLGSVRVVPMDGRKRDPQDEDYELYNGWPLGHWDGDTLVVESTGFNNITWMLWTGYFHSNKMTVTERFRRNGDILYYQFTVTDPEVLAEPWTSDTYVRRAGRDPLARMEEQAPCRENDAKEIADMYYRG